MEDDPTDAVERTLKLLRGLAELGIAPRSVRCGDVEVAVASVSNGEAASESTPVRAVEGGYISRALAARKVGG
jgi:hypothetical protein